MQPDPIKVALVFLGATCTAFGCAAPLLYFAWLGFRDGSYPVTKNYHVRGVLARLAACAVGLFGLLTVACGVAILWFGIYRVRQLL